MKHLRPILCFVFFGFFAHPATKSAGEPYTKSGHNKEASYFFDKDGKIRPEIMTNTGLARLAEKHYEGDMEQARKEGELIFKARGVAMFPLLWMWDIDSVINQARDSNTSKKTSSEIFFQKQARLYNEDGTIKEEYRYPKGHAKYAEDWLSGDKKKYRYPKDHAKYAEDRPSGDMDQALKEAFFILKIPEISRPTGEKPLRASPQDDLSLLLDPRLLLPDSTNAAVFEYLRQAVHLHLGWTGDLSATRTSKSFYRIRKSLLDANGALKQEWEGNLGQARYARTYTKGDIRETQNIRNQFGPDDPTLKSWSLLSVSSADTVEETIHRFLDAGGMLKPEYISQEGYFLYAEKYTEKDLNTAFIHSTWLPALLREKLAWRHYDGTIQDFQRDIKTIEKYPGTKGLMQFALEFYNGVPIRAYENGLSVFQGDSEKLYQKTKWLPYYSHYYDENITRFYERDKRALISSKARRVNPVYLGMQGYLRFAEIYYTGDMLMAYHNVMAVLETRDLSSLMEWALFPGHADEYRSIRQFILKSGAISRPPAEGMSASHHISSLTEQFVRKNNIARHYKQNIENMIKSFLDIQQFGSCSGAF